MIKRCMTTLLIFMALSSTVAHAKVISYELRTQDKQIKSYATDKLVEGFLAYKQGEDSEIYMNFIKDLKSGKYEAFQDDTKKYVSYDLIVQAFLEAKENNESFNVEEFVKQAKGIDLLTETFNSSHSALDEDGDYNYSNVATVVNDVSKAMDKNMPIITKKQQDEINNDFTRGRWREDLNINTIDEGCKRRERFEDWADGSYFRKLGLPSYSQAEMPMSELKGKGERNAKLDQKYFNNEEYKYLTDLDNYEKFEGLDINFNSVVNKNISVNGSLQENYYGKTTEGVQEEEGLFLEHQDGYEQLNLFPEYVHKYRNPIIWRPDFERGMIDEINKLRESKGMKPLTYDVNLHAMSRYCAKRNHYAFSRGQCVSNQGMCPSGALRFWPNGSVGNAFSQKVQCNEEDIVRLEGNENKMFSYKGHVKAMSAMNPIFSKPKDFLDYWEYYKNPSNSQWKHGMPVEFGTYDPTPNMEQSLLNPNMTKIGIGSIWEAPANALEINGALGVFITVE